MKIIIIFLSAIFINITHADSPTPVMIGGNDGLDACLTLGSVVSPEGLNDVSVYSKPDGSSTVIERLASGTYIMICDSSGDAWSGIVFAGDNSPSCKVTSSSEARHPYQGECKSGWVKTIVIEILAG